MKKLSHGGIQSQGRQIHKYLLMWIMIMSTIQFNEIIHIAFIRMRREKSAITLAKLEY